MAKKSSVAADGSPPVEPKSRKSPALSRTPLRASSLLDTRVIYCGDNLEQLAKLPDAPPRRMQKEEGRMMKPARLPILHSSFFIQNSPVTASHYVKVMLDQIFGENNFTNGITNKIILPKMQKCRKV